MGVIVIVDEAVFALRRCIEAQEVRERGIIRGVGVTCAVCCCCLCVWRWGGRAVVTRMCTCLRSIFMVIFFTWVGWVTSCPRDVIVFQNRVSWCVIGVGVGMYFRVGV